MDTPLNTTTPAPWEAPLVAALERMKEQARVILEARRRFSPTTPE